MKHLLYLDTSTSLDPTLERLAKTTIAGHCHRLIKVADSHATNLKRDDLEFVFLDIYESARDADTLLVGVPANWQHHSILPQLLARLMKVSDYSTPFSGKQLEIILSSPVCKRELGDKWSQAACQLDMDLIEVVTDETTAIRAALFLFAGKEEPPKISFSMIFKKESGG